MIYATTGLVDAVLSIARENDPDPVSFPLTVTPADDLDVDLPTGTPVYTHFYMPDVADSIRAVIGVDLGTPTTRTHGRFISHPNSLLDLSVTDDLHEVVFVAVPPWNRESLAVFDRQGRRIDLELLDTTPPDETAANL